MKKRILCLLVLLGLGMQAQATLISFMPSSQQMGLGGTTTVDLVISELGDDIVSAFDLSIFFDDTILGYESFEFGTGLDIFGFGTINDAIDWGFGEVEVFELSFDFDEDLDLFQPNSFVLGTFTFTGLQFGTSALDIFVWAVGGAFDPATGFVTELDVTTVSGSIEVPEPGTLLLFMGGLLCLGMRRRIRAARA